MNKDDLQKLALPDTSGVYFFVDTKDAVLYIGKATSLKDRVRSYFSTDIAESRGPKIVKMLNDAATVRFEETDSVLEALLLEARLIKKHQPPANTREKDNKSFNGIGITKEDFPRILLIRQRDIVQGKAPELIEYFGPFPQGAQVKQALKLIRKIFPFRDTCTPCPVSRSPLDTGREGKCKPCFNAQIGLCPGVCTGVVSGVDYKKTVRSIRTFLQGKKKALITHIEKDMHAAAKKERFEEAAQYKKQLHALTHIHDIALISDNTAENSTTSAQRIEAYDIAHISETNRVGVMVVVENGVPNKNEYRKFTIQTALPGDTNALKEVLERRLAHPEWHYPSLIVVDGSTAQINTAKRTLAAAGMNTPLAGVVKDERHKPKNIKWSKAVASKAAELEKAVLLANAEAHRFAIGFYKKRQRKQFLQ